MQAPMYGCYLLPHGCLYEYDVAVNRRVPIASAHLGLLIATFLIAALCEVWVATSVAAPSPSALATGRGVFTTATQAMRVNGPALR